MMKRGAENLAEEPTAETGFKGDLCGCRGSEERRVKQRNHYIIIYE
jgi:hypothetical protein